MNDTITRLGTALSDRYRIDREVGEGGMATVYLAEDLKQRHSSLGYLSPAKFEAKNWPEAESIHVLASLPAVGEHRLAEPDSTPLQAEEALLTQGREEEEIRLT